jgi:beta-phosphoglucomutase
MSPVSPSDPARQLAPAAAIFDLDGVLTDTTELHYQSWVELAQAWRIAFDRRTYDTMRGLSRPDSLRIFLADRAAAFSPPQQQEISDRKNAAFLRRVAEMTPDDLYPGVRQLLIDLRAGGLRVGLASSSRNARRVVEQLALGELLEVLVDANDAPRSKPDPQVFQLAAARLGVQPPRCVAIEDARAGVDAAIAAGMRVIGVGPADRVAGAHRVVPETGLITVGMVQALLDSA